MGCPARPVWTNQPIKRRCVWCVCLCVSSCVCLYFSSLVDLRPSAELCLAADSCLAAVSAASPVQDLAVLELVSMGFDRQDALAALQNNNNSVEQAVLQLIGSASPPPPPEPAAEPAESWGAASPISAPTAPPMSVQSTGNPNPNPQPLLCLQSTGILTCMHTGWCVYMPTVAVFEFSYNHLVHLSFSCWFSLIHYVRWFLLDYLKLGFRLRAGSSTTASRTAAADGLLGVQGTDPIRCGCSIHLLRSLRHNHNNNRAKCRRIASLALVQLVKIHLVVFHSNAHALIG